MKKNRAQGFTLIELLFVIAILAVLTVITITVYQRHAATARYNRVALEMQQVLSAALTYSVENNQTWPSNNADFPTCDLNDDQIQQFVENYLPNADRQSQLGDNYCWGADKTHHRFWVAVATTDRYIAARIAARLPNAVTTIDPAENSPTNPTPCAESGTCYVRAEVALPGFSKRNSNNFTAGYCQPDSTLTPGQTGCAEDYAAETAVPFVFTYDVYLHCPSPSDSAYVVAMPNFMTNKSMSLQSLFSCRQLTDPTATDATPSTLPLCCANPDFCPVSAAKGVQQQPTQCVADGQGGFHCKLHFQAIGVAYDHLSARSYFLYKVGGIHNGQIGGSYFAYCRPAGSSISATATRL